MKNKRSPLALIAAVAFVLASSACLTPARATDGDEAVAYQLDDFHDGVAASPLRLPLHVIWTTPLSGTIAYPIIAGKHVYASSGTTLYGIDALAGAILWTQTAQYGWIAGEAYGNDRVYATGSSPSGVFLYAFDHTTGQQVWASSVTTTGNYSFSTSPTAGNGIVYTVGDGGVPTVFAIQASTGKLLWTQSVGGGDDTSPVVTRAGVYVAFACPEAYDLDPLTGRQIWFYDGGCHGGGGSIPVLADGLLYIGDDIVHSQNSDILFAGTGQLKALYESSFTPAVYNHIAYAVSYGGSNLQAIGARTGGYVWSVPAPTNDSFGVPPIVVPSDGLVFEATNGGLLVAYRLNTGRLVLSISLGSSVAFGSAMAVVENMLVVDTANGLVAFSAR